MANAVSAALIRPYWTPSSSNSPEISVKFEKSPIREIILTSHIHLNIEPCLQLTMSSFQDWVGCLPASSP